MALNKTIKRELQVAFSKDSQPVLFRLMKYILLGTGLYFFWRSKLFWIIFAILIVLSVLLHFWYRYKTKGWTKSFGLWKYHNPRRTISINILPELFFVLFYSSITLLHSEAVTGITW